MPWIRRTAAWVHPYICAIGGWFGVMSGGFSVVFGFFALPMTCPPQLEGAGQAPSRALPAQIVGRTQLTMPALSDLQWGWPL